MELNNKQIDYQYFDYFNKLFERLKLLIASQQAGHKNHTNEIESILEELRKGGIIFKKYLFRRSEEVSR